MFLTQPLQREESDGAEETLPKGREEYISDADDSGQLEKPRQAKPAKPEDVSGKFRDAFQAVAVQ